MRQDFDNNLTMDEKLTRIYKAKQVGRKHQKQISQSTKNNIAARKQAHRNSFNAKRAKVRSKLIAKYWAGEIEEYPV